MSDAADGQHVTVSVGDPATAVTAALGAPDVERPLKNPAPATMGAAVIEYNFTNDVVTLLRVAERRRVRSVQFVLDPGATILRILENPNPYVGAAPRLQRGTAFPADKAIIPTAPGLRVRPR